MLRGLLKLGLLAGAGWYAYRKLRPKNQSEYEHSNDLFGTTSRPKSGDMQDRVTQLVNQAAEAIRERTARSAESRRGAGGGFDHTPTKDGAPREAHAAAMAAMPAVQPNEAFEDAAARVAKGETAPAPAR
jgi:hypothetical protein